MNKCEQYCRTIQRMANAGGGGGLLPAAYQQVEYLQDNNYAFISTGIKANDIDWENDCFYFESEALVSENGCGALFGSFLASADGKSVVDIVGAELSYSVSSGRQWVPYVKYTHGKNWTVTTNAGLTVPSDTWLSVSGYLKKGKQEIDIENIGYVQADSSSVPDFSTIYNSAESSPYIFLFSQSSTRILTGTGIAIPNSMLNNRLNGKMKSIKFWTDNQGLLRNYIPCYRKSDNKAGMYDTVTKQFHYQNATDHEAYQFIVGPDV